MKNENIMNNIVQDLSFSKFEDNQNNNKEKVAKCIKKLNEVFAHHMSVA